MKQIEHPVFGKTIHSYSRAQAIEDGVLADISELAKEAGFNFPVAITQGVLNILNPWKEIEGQGQSFDGRAWDMLAIWFFQY